MYFLKLRKLKILQENKNAICGSNEGILFAAMESGVFTKESNI